MRDEDEKKDDLNTSDVSEPSDTSGSRSSDTDKSESEPNDMDSSENSDSPSSGSKGKDRSVNLTDNELFKPLLYLSIPIVLSQILQVGYNLADTFWVGQLGQEPLTALTYAWPLIFLMISIGAGLTIAGTVLVSQNKGAGKHDRVDHVAGQTIGLVILVALFFSVIGFVFAPTLLTFVGATRGTVEHALSIEYTRTIFTGVIFVFGFFIFQALLRGWGDTRTPLYLMAFGVFLNVLLDPLLILGFKDNVLFTALGLEGLQSSLYSMTGFEGFGVQGAAIATVLSRGLGAFIGLGLLFTGYVGIKPSISDLIPRLDTAKKIFEIGAPASIEQSTRALGIVVLTALVAFSGGDNAVAAFGIGNRITSLVFLPALGFARGTETAVGQNLGANQVKRAKKAVTLSAGVIAASMVLVSFLAFLYSDAITDVFINNGENAEIVVGIGSDYLQIVGTTFIFLGVFQIIQGGFRGSGSTRLAMVFSIMSLWVFRIPAAYILIEWTSLAETGVWYGIAFSNVAIVIVAGAWFLRGTWTDNVIESSEETDGSDSDFDPDSPAFGD